MDHIKIYFFPLLILSAVSLSSCDLIDSAVGGNENSPERDNPLDPNNNDAELAQIELIGGYDFESIFTVNSNKITFEWTTTDSGVTESLQFRFKYASYTEDLSSVAFSDYITAARFEIFGLDESLSDLDIHKVQIEVSSSMNENIEAKIYTASFLVNKISTTGFLFNPNIIGKDQSNNYAAKIYVDEVSSIDDIVAFRLDIITDSNENIFNPNSAVIFSDERNFFYQPGATIFSLNRVVGDTLRIESAFGGTSYTGKSGYGELGEITISSQLIEGSDSLKIEISPSSYFILRSGERVNITQFDTAWIYKESE